ncbi:MAG TPA: hypothetical protein VI357_06575 [Mycobacteriales bacterium]
MTTPSPIPDYADDVMLLVEPPPTASRPTIRLRAAGTGVGALVDLSATGASRLAGLLESAVVVATTRGIGGD